MATKKSTPSQPTGLFRGNAKPRKNAPIPPAPPWRRFSQAAKKSAPPGSTYRAQPAEIEAVNAALLLRRPLLITGKPGVGKSSLAEAVAYELGLGPVLKWPITSRSTLQDGVYRYDAIGRFQEGGKDSPIEKFLRLGPVGTALAAPGGRPRVLLVDELDKADIDLPNDLLNLLEDGEYEIPEISRHPKARKGSVPKFRVHSGDETVEIPGGMLRATPNTYPVIFFTSNGEREFSPAFHRRCLSLRISFPPEGEEQKKHFRAILKAQLGSGRLADSEADALIQAFGAALEKGDLAADQLLNLAYTSLESRGGFKKLAEGTKNLLLRPLGAAE